VPAHPAASAERVVNVLPGHHEAHVAVFPELFLSGYTFSDLEQLVRLCKPELEHVAQAAAECRTAVLIGYPQLAGGGVSPRSVQKTDRKEVELRK
jgi:predicted amidohydrolase